ncbi:hypothetical protein [Archangium lipolyticum]|uniref:hypothetical protein n=1 Tax=Archangium lipolyticum TaxID=2970465 RepID=UPI00214A61EF|nr:hypothetical protein [Archangium lipolyticum]
MNTDPNTRGIARIQLRFVCQDQVLNGQPYPPGPPWYVHVWGRCHPNNCDWKEVGAKRLGNGSIYAVYDHGYAKKYVTARLSPGTPEYLWVYRWTDFKDPARADFGAYDWFRRE